MSDLEARKQKHKEAMKRWREANKDYWKKYNADVKNGARIRKKRQAKEATNV